MSARIMAVILAYAAGGSLATGAPAIVRDWKAHPAIVELNTPETVFAIGDAHGDPERLAAVMAAAKLTDGVTTAPDKVKWIAGKSVLVVVGDMIDKGHDSLGVIALLRALQNDAARQGGQVIITMGNHEAEFLANPLGDKTQDFAQELKAAHLDPVEVAHCAGDLGQFLCALPVGVRVNDWFFSHGGNSGNQTIAGLSAAIESGFASAGFATPQLIGDNSILEARLNKNGPAGMPWFMNGSKATDPKSLLQQYASKLGVRHIVEGHQNGSVKFPDGNDRKDQALFQRFGVLFLIDGGMSRGIDGSNSPGGALRIDGPAGQSQAVVICTSGPPKTIWDSKGNQDRGEKHCDQ